jgi:hypothetical protein
VIASCNAGYFADKYQNSSIKSCIACDSACGTCSGGAFTDCLTCNSADADLFAIATTVGSAKTCGKKCTFGQRFIALPKGCSDCATMAYNPITQACVATCPTGTYPQLDITGKITDCLNCPPGVTACTSPSLATTCDATLVKQQYGTGLTATTFC